MTAAGMPEDVRLAVLARPCQGCGHARHWHMGWMNLYGCTHVLPDDDGETDEHCPCPGFDVVVAAP